MAVVICSAPFVLGPTGAESRGTIELGVPGRTNATPWIDARGDFVAVAWGASDGLGKTDVFAATSRDRAVTFSAPIRVNRSPGDARLGGELPPRVSVARASSGKDPEVIVSWTATGNGTEIRLARSTDGGRTFQAAESLQRAGAAGDRGWQALAVDEEGRAHSVWLDHRGLATDRSGHHGSHHSGHDTAGAAENVDGVAMAQLSSLYFSATQAGAASSERELAKGVCYCCKTALAVGHDGALYAAWRHVYPGNIRDIAFMTSRDSGRTFGPPTRISQDGWELSGCPDDGPAIAVDRKNVVHVVWPTVLEGTEPEGALFYASTRDGENFTPRQRIPTLGSLKPTHPQITIDAAGRPFVAWDELQRGTRKVVVREVKLEPSGRTSFGPAAIINDSSPGSYPVLAATSREVLVVWASSGTKSSTIAVRRVELPEDTRGN